MSEQSGCNFGEHLTIDGYRGSLKKLDNRSLILKCLNELPGILGMKKLTEPQIYPAPDNLIKDPGGWSGFVIVAESHISIHTFPKRGFVSIDVYTCKNNLDKDFIVDYFKKIFSLRKTEVNLLKRGTEYPKENIYH